MSCWKPWFPNRAAAVGSCSMSGMCLNTALRNREKLRKAGIFRQVIYVPLFTNLSCWGLFRFDMKALLSALDGFPGFIRCLGPNCGSGQIHPGRDKSPCMTCSTCKFKTCYTHQIPWHAAQTCAEFDAFRNRPKAELASAKYLAEKTVTCPNCGAHIEKDKGCDHMRCMF